MASFTVEPGVYRRAPERLRWPAAAGFFLADPLEDRGFRLTEWRPIKSEGLEEASHHLELKDETRAEIIKWAWDSGAVLVESHPHGPLQPAAAFSPTDIQGLREWVPHLWWRLRGRPYGAIVTAGATIDALAWIESPHRPEQVSSLFIDGEGPVTLTARTLPRWVGLGDPPA